MGLAHDLRRGGGDRRLRVLQKEARPPREVVRGRGPVAREVPLGEGGQASSREKVPGRRQPFLEQHERRLLALPRAEADEPLLGEMPEDVDPPLPGGRDAAALQRRVRLGPGERAALQGARQHLRRAPQRRGVELELPIPPGAARHDAGVSRRSIQRTSAAGA